MPGKFVLKRGETGKFRWNLVGTNGRIVATSEAYGTKASAVKGIEAVRRLAADAALVDQTTAEGDQGILKPRHRSGGRSG